MSHDGGIYGSMRNMPFNVIRIPGEGVEAVEAETARTFDRHTHEQFGVGLVVRGAQRSASGRGTVEAVSGDLITVNPGEVHDGAPIGGARRWRMLYFDPARITRLLNDMAEDGGMPACEFAYPVVRNGEAVRLFRTLFRALVAGARQADVNETDEVLILLLAHLLDRKRPAGALPRTPVARARALIDANPLADLSLSQLAGVVGLSRFQLLRGFARLTGLTPHAYLLQQRIHLARRLIAQGMPLAEAALNSGFSDQSHMTRRFVGSFGYSPGVYARMPG